MMKGKHRVSETGRQDDKATAQLGPDLSDVAEAAAGPVPTLAGKPRRRRARSGLMVLLTFVVVVQLGLLATLALTGTFVRLPVWAVAEAETRINRALARSLPDGAVSIGAIEVGVDDDWIPRLRLEDTRLLHADGTPILMLPDTRVSFDLNALLEGQVRPSTLRLSGARIDLTRGQDGALDVALGGQTTVAQPIDGVPALFDLIDAAFAQPILADLTRIEGDALTLTLTDARSGRVWDVGDGRLRLENRPTEVRAEIGMTLLSANGPPAQAQMTVISEKGASLARMTATVDQVAAADLAGIVPPLAPLGAADAPISGRLAVTLEAAGITALEGQLTFGSGALRPTAAARPIDFDRASMEIGYDPQLGRVNLTALEVESPTLRLTASGHSYLTDASGVILTGPLGARLPDAFLTQIHISQMKVDPAGLFEKPVIFTEGAIDLRLRTDPFTLDIGQVSLVEAGRRLSAKGQVGAGADGWTAAIDLALDEIGHENLLALWPVTLVPKTRKWLEDNVLDGTLSDVKAALRIAPGKEPRLTLGYDFRATDVRFIRTLPPIRDADGYATIEGQTYTMVVSRGSVTPPLGGVIDMTGSVFSVLDITQIPAQAEVILKTDSTLTAALSLLDEPPFQFLTKAGREVQIGDGRAVLDATLRFPLIPKLLAGDVSFSVNGRVFDFFSERLVAGKGVAAPDLSLTADPRGLRVSGPGTIGVVPFDVTFTQPFGKDAGPARIEGTVALSQATVTEFGLGLPEAMVSGEGQGMVTIDLPKGEPARLTLVSDLNRIGLVLPGTGWDKPPATLGRLTVDAVLSKPAVIERIALTAPGLDAEGSVTLLPGGGLEVARFSPVLIGDWLQGSVQITGRGEGRPVGITLTGG
ncbi:MAG: hypothetical protein RLZZ563_1935, partial [Pseudomonadota bacterium]